MNETATVPSTPQLQSAAPLYFPVSPTKLVVMSICTLSLYEFYWFYENWWLVKEREKSGVSPILRALFAYFFVYSLFSKIRTTGHEKDIPISLPAGPLAAGWIIITLLWKLPDPFWLVTFAAPLSLVPVQRAANQINEALVPDYDKNARFSGSNIATVVLGGLLFLATVIGTFLSEP